MASGRPGAWAANSSGNVATGTGWAVSFHSRRMVSRSAGARMSRVADRLIGCRKRRLEKTHQSSRHRLGAGAIEQVGGVLEHAVDSHRGAIAAALLAKTDGEVELVVAATGSNAVVSPGRSKPAGALFWNASITWNSGWRASERAGLTTSTRRSNGSS